MLNVGGFYANWDRSEKDRWRLETLEQIIRAYYIKSYYKMVDAGGAEKLYEINSGLNTGDRFTTWFNSITALCNVEAAKGWCKEHLGEKLTLSDGVVLDISTILYVILGDDLGVGLDL